MQMTQYILIIYKSYLFQDSMSNKFNIQGYEIYPSQRLGAGAYGQVYIGQNLRTNQIVAVKIIDIQKLSKKALQKMIKVEINLLKQIKHPNILEVIETRQTEEFFYLITQKCDSDLQKLMRLKKQFTQQECLYIIFQICEAFKELKSRNILHRDLKPSNILIKNGLFKLADFGVSKQIVPDALCKNTTRVGTPLYMSMQVLRGEQYNQKCDIWSLGCIMYKLLHGQLLWEQKSDQQIMKIFETTKQVSVPIKRTDLSQNCRLFLQSCLRLKEEDRSSWLALASIPLNRQKEQIRKKQQEIKESFMRLVQPNLSWSVSKQSQQSPQTGKSTNVNSNSKKSATEVRDYNDQHQRTCFDAIFGCCFQLKKSQNKYVDSRKDPKSNINIDNTFSEINLPIVGSQIKQSSPKLIKQQLVPESLVPEQKNESKREQPQKLTQLSQMITKQPQRIIQQPQKIIQQPQKMTRQQQPNEQDSSSSEQAQPSKSSSLDTQQVKEALQFYMKMQILKAIFSGVISQNQNDEEQNADQNQGQNPDSKADNPKTKSDPQATNNSKTAQLPNTQSQKEKPQNKVQNHGDLNNIDEKQKQQVINEYKKPIVLQGKKLSDSKIYVDVKEIKQINGERKYYTNMNDQIQSLFHSNLAIEMNEFCHFNWTALKFICLKNCQVDNYQWKIFVQNAFIFNNIHKIQIQKNQISTVKGQDLEKFKQLSCIIFHVNSQQTNPLSPMSKQSLRNFKRKNQKVQVQYELQQQEKPQCINM